jgi:hypothetical protein
MNKYLFFHHIFKVNELKNNIKLTQFGSIIYLKKENAIAIRCKVS